MAPHGSGTRSRSRWLTSTDPFAADRKTGVDLGDARLPKQEQDAKPKHHANPKQTIAINGADEYCGRSRAWRTALGKVFQPGVGSCPFFDVDPAIHVEAKSGKLSE